MDDFSGAINSNKAFLLVLTDKNGRRIEGIYGGIKITLDVAISQAKAQGLEVVTVHHFR